MELIAFIPPGTAANRLRPLKNAAGFSTIFIHYWEGTSDEILAAVHGGSTAVLYAPTFCLYYLFAVSFKDAVGRLSEVVDRQITGRQVNNELKKL